MCTYYMNFNSGSRGRWDEVFSFFSRPGNLLARGSLALVAMRDVEKIFNFRGETMRRLFPA
jgi:hypothetical protein